jgi:hypothetical protein
MKPIILDRGAKITRPGIYQMPAPDYFADPCPAPSLNQSLAKVLLYQSPLHAFHEHPRLCPPEADDEEEKYNKTKAIGNAAHSLLIGRGKDIAIAPAEFANWQKKDAQTFKAKAIEDGKEPIIAAHYERAVVLVQNTRRSLAAVGWGDAFEPERGFGEVVLAWQEDGLWLRCMIDWLTLDFRVVYDLKSTAASAAPQAIPNKMCDDGWDVQAAMIERGLDVLDPENAGRRRFRFVAQENYAPFAMTPCEIPESSLTLGRRKLAAAIQIWRGCYERKVWPGYPLEPTLPQYPNYAETRWLEREMALADAGLIDFADDRNIGRISETAATETRRDIMRAG